MRLTLRNMLAYLNSIIEDPSENEELRRKIEESEFATGLVHRIRSATGRQRLGAPGLDGRGIGLDPNSVAEYLDNALPPDKIPELEKVCVESDVHLAEVAACYQILALYLRGTVEVDPGLRDRIQGMGKPGGEGPAASASAAQSPGVRSDVRHPPASADAEPVPPPPVMIPPAAPPPSVTAASRKPFEVPEYLRVGQRGKWKPLAMTLLLAFVLSAVALRAMGPFDSQHPLMRLLGVSATVEVVRQTPSSIPTAEPESPLDETAELPDANRGAGRTRESDEQSAPDTPPEAAPDSTVTRPDPPTLEAPDEQPAPKAPMRDDTPREAPEETATPRDHVKPDPFAPPLPMDEPAPVETGPVEPMPVPGDEGVPAESPTAPMRPVEVGFVRLSEPHFLARFVAESTGWFRLPARSILMSGDRLMVLPTYRPEIVLTPGVQVVFAGPSSVQTLPPNDQNEPGLAIEHGRALIATAGVAGARIHLDLAGHQGIVTFQEAASEMGVDVSLYLPPGVNPELQAARPVVQIYTTIGRIQWQAQGATAATPIEQGQVRIIDQSETRALDQTPAWMQGTDLRDVDKDASKILESSIAADRPISLSLRERAEDRRQEIRALAARCLAYLDSFETLIKEFSDERQRAYWSAEYTVLRHALARSPETAAKVRTTFEAFCGPDAEELYRLSWGFSVEQLREGADRHLVDLLDHDSLRIRVFAFENLSRITGKTLTYMPEATSARRKSSIQRWREQLQNGAIVYETLPSPLQIPR